jgi:parallel beta-helix repeat protein
MKKTIFISLFLLSIISLYAGNYYISSSSGSDTNDGKTIQSAWMSLSKLNKSMNLLQPGDSVLFKCNDTLVGQILVLKSGNNNKSICFGSYGSGNKPIISGKTTVISWSQSSANIWDASCPDCNGSVTNFFINQIPQQIGRWPNINEPNKGYRTFTTHIGLNQIVDKTLPDSINWTGAEAVVRRVRWILDRLTIKAQKQDTLEFKTSVSYEFLDGFGYFIQNDPRTLDQQGEWYFNPDNKQFTIFSETDPNTLLTETTKIDTLIKLAGVKYITVENLHFDGSGKIALFMNNCKTISIRNNDFTCSGENGIVMNNSDGVIFENNQINHTNNNAFGQWNCNSFTMRNNTIKNTSLVPGMGQGADGQYMGVTLSGNKSLFEFNTIDSVGYIGLAFNGDSVIIQNNVISNYCMTKDDGGGIYTWNTGSPINYSRKVIGNILFNAIGAPEGSGWSGVAAEGIYMDDRSPNVDIIGNTVFNCGNFGIFLHNSNHINVIKNVVYNNETQLFMGHDNIAPAFPIKNCSIDSNIFVSKFANQRVASLHTIDDGISDLGSFDYNYYCRPLEDSLIMDISYNNGAAITEDHSLESWRLQYNKDLHSGKSPISITAYTINGVKSSNYITNGMFTNNTTGWYCWANHNNGQISLDSNGGVSGGALHAIFTTQSGNKDGYQIIVSNSFAFSTNKTYRLRFAVRSNKLKTTLQIIPRKSGNPYNLVADQKNFVADTLYQQFEYVFTPTLAEPNSRIDFQFSEGETEIWLDNIELVEVDATKTNPDDYILFEYNATKNDKTISLNDDYIDAKGIPVPSNITLKPFSSIILFKNINHVTETILKKKNSEIAVRIFPNPVNEQLNIEVTDCPSSYCRLYNSNGLLIKSFNLEKGLNTFNVDNLRAGLYLIQIPTKQGNRIQKVIKY